MLSAGDTGALIYGRDAVSSSSHLSTRLAVDHAQGLGLGALTCPAHGRTKERRTKS